jgi:Domain of unknown function DUF11
VHRLPPVVLVLLLALLADAPDASAQIRDGQGTDRFVTVVARQCPQYTDVTANLARNDIQESLKDLGANTAYTSGEPIDPEIEAENQPDPPCSPIPNWRFTLGTGYQTRAVSGPWGSLSIVTDPYDTSIVTQPSAPLLDYEGRPTGDTVAGAVTFELTQDQADHASRGQSLWIQGGTTTDPILNEAFPDTYGFAALRCAIDNLNGDNVEYIAYPSGTEHVFCYAYYVTPPPTSGTIIIRKEVSDPPGADQNFQFAGNLSFNADGTFDLNVVDGGAASQTFYRAERTPGAPPWTVREVVPAGWNLTGITCQSPGPSTEVISQAATSVAINLVAGDTVTCTYTNEFRVPAGQLFLAKSTLGGTGIFGFRVSPVGGGDELTARAETRRRVLPRLAQPAPLELAPGRYRIMEDLPQSSRGTWNVFRVWCGGGQIGRIGPRAPEEVVVRIRDEAGSACLFVNRFIPAGGLRINKITVGGTGRFDYTIRRLREPSTVYEQSARTRRALLPARARGDSTGHIELGAYVIQEIGPAAEGGEWQLRLVVCDGRLVPAIEGRAIVRLTEGNPVKRCAFLNQFVPDDPPEPPDPPGPPDPPVPGPDPPGPNPTPVDPDPDLVIRKQPGLRVVSPGERVIYTVTVRNRGPVAVEDVVLGEASGRGEAFAAIRGRGTSSCAPRVVLGREVVGCRIGDLAPGASRTLRVVARITNDAGRTVVNVAAVGSSTPERNARNNVAAARVRVRSAACPPVAAARSRPIARAAC